MPLLSHQSHASFMLFCEREIENERERGDGGSGLIYVIKKSDIYISDKVARVTSP